MKKLTITALMALAVLTFSVPAAAETFTASNGVLSIDLPDDSWKEMEDPARWIVLSDGANLITIDHYSNGEKLPEMSVADDHYVNVYQAVFSTQNEVFIITGSVVDAEKIPAIANSIISAKVLKYDTKTKTKGNETAIKAEDFSLNPVDKTMYVNTDGLNVRSGCSTNDAIIGSLDNGASVRVKGFVQKDGKDFGWVQIDFNGGSGYVSSVYLTDTAPAKNEKKNTPENLSFTGTAATVYAMTGTALSIYKATDGNWYDKNGIKFTWLTDTKLTNDDGDSFTTSLTFGSTYFTGNSTTVYSLSGTPVTIRENTDGYWYTDSGVKMTWLDGSRLESDGGEAFVTDQPDTNDYSDQEGEGDLVYCEYCGQWYEAGNVFRNHICPARDAALAAEN